MESSIKITYQHLNKLPVATITLKRNIVLKNNISDLNKKDIVITIDAGKTKLDTLKLNIVPSYTLNEIHFHYIKGIDINNLHKNKEVDNRVENIVKEYTKSLTRVYKLATSNELKKLKKLVVYAIKKLDKAKRC